MCNDKVNSNVNSVISERLAKDKDLFFVDYCVMASKYGIDIIKKKKFQGVKNNDVILIPPIYEDIEIASNDVAIVKLLDTYAIFSLRECRQLSEFEYCSVHISNDMIVLHKGNGRSAIYNMNTSNFLYQTANYDEFNLKDSSTEYIWARRNVFFDYIHRESGRIISLPGIIMAYDTKHGIFGLDEHNKVCNFNEYGVEDQWRLRQLVQNEGGFFALRNYTYNIEHIIDIYGNILNI